ncbi:MAG TPA: hypothetical protein PLQ97_02635 [Myxococcota bacterium]|nr:hypothetical protein [Myxococcota bacterium]HQK50727.1 hypothetical protein [Myxococcota bacterium]
MALTLELVPIPIERIPEAVRPMVLPEVPAERRLMLARAALPLPPEDLLTVLAWLARNDPVPEVTRTARDSVDALPWPVLSAAIASHPDAGVLDYLARDHGANHEGVWSLVAGNRHAADVTLAYIARHGRGPVLEQIAANQMRYQRFPAIVEALYYNPETRMGTVSTVLENAVRLGVDLSHIPGYQEIVASIFGEEAAQKILERGGGAPAEGTPEETPAEPPVERPLPSEAVVVPVEDLARQAEAGETGLDRLLAEALGTTLPGGEGEAAPGDIGDEDFYALLAAAAGTGSEEQEETEDRRTEALWNLVAKLTVAQKVRMALIGDEAARSLLIRDSRRMVFLSVLKSPRLTDREIANYAKNRALPEEVIRAIATNRDWTRLYPVKLGLVTNPKCPPVMAATFLKSLSNRDLKHIVQSRDVPGYILRQAKQLLDAREVGGKVN